MIIKIVKLILLVFVFIGLFFIVPNVFMGAYLVLLITIFPSLVFLTFAED